MAMTYLSEGEGVRGRDRGVTGALSNPHPSKLDC